MGPFDLLRPEPAPRFGRAPTRNAYVELHNVIAAAESTDDFGPDDLDRISRAHGVDLATAFLAERALLYERLLDDRLANGDLDAADRRVLSHVARTLALAPADLRPSHERAFGNAVTATISDDCLDVEERLLLYKLQHLLGLDPRLADGAYGVLARERFLVTVARVLCDGELSPEEEGEVEAVRDHLSVEIPEPVAEMLRKARLRWEARHGEMPSVRVGVSLREGEAGHYVAAGVRWRALDGGQLRAVSPAHAEALKTGRTARLRVPPSVLYGRSETGQAVVTDQRLILLRDGAAPDEYPFPSLVQTLRFENGAVVRTRGDRRVFIDVGPTENDAFYTVLYRSMHPGRPPD